MTHRCLGPRLAMSAMTVFASGLLHGELAAQDELTRAIGELADLNRKEHSISVLAAASVRSREGQGS